MKKTKQGSGPRSKPLEPDQVGDAKIFVLLAASILLFWAPALLPGRALFLRDLSIEIIPYRSFWVGSGGFALWNSFGFLGMPFAANPQLGAFYPLNYIFFIDPIWKGLVVYIIVHYSLAAFFSFLLLREMDFSKAGSAFFSVAFCFSGIYSSFSNLIVLLSVASWVSVSGWLLIRSIKRRWLSSLLWLGLVFAFQILAGDPQVFASSLLICAALGLFYLWKSGPLPGGYKKLFGAILFSLLTSAVLAGVQSLLTLEMIPLSNRASGYSFEDFTLWSLYPKNLATLFFPNNFFPPQTMQWAAGFFLSPSFLLSLYPGVTVLLLAAFSFRSEKKSVWLWPALFALGIFLALGEHNPAYRLFYRIPLFNLFRIPEKFFLLSGFSLAMLGAIGFESLIKEPPRNLPRFAPPVLFITGIGFLAVSIILQDQGSASEAAREAHRILVRASQMRSLAVLFAGAGWIFFQGRARKSRVFGLGIIVIAYLDLAGAHFRLNPATSADFYTAGPEAVAELDRLRSQRPETLRIASVHPSRDEILVRVRDAREFFVMVRDWMDPFWGVYYRVDDVLAKGSFYLGDIDLFRKLLKESQNRELLFGRSAVSHIYEPESGVRPLPDSLSRAMVFYRAEFIPDRERMIKLWSDPSFDSREKVLLEKSAGAAGADINLSAEPAQILSYANEKVAVKFAAKAPGWLVLFDSYYPGWRAHLDGKDAAIVRADVFFRAVAVGPGEHVVEFRYLPAGFVYGIIISSAGLVGWLGLLIFARIKWKTKSSAGSGSSFSWF